MSYSILVASLAITAIIVYIMFKLDVTTDQDSKGGNHFLLQLLMLFFVMGGLLLSGKAAMDIDKDCYWQPPLVADDNYTLTCEDNTSTTGFTMFKGVLWFVRLVATYIMIYFIYRALLFTNVIVRKE